MGPSYAVNVVLAVVLLQLYALHGQNVRTLVQGQNCARTNSGLTCVLQGYNSVWKDAMPGVLTVLSRIELIGSEPNTTVEFLDYGIVLYMAEGGS